MTSVLSVGDIKKVTFGIPNILFDDGHLKAFAK